MPRNTQNPAVGQLRKGTTTGGPALTASELLRTTCVANVVESYVSSENISEQGAGVAPETASETVP